MRVGPAFVLGVCVGLAIAWAVVVLVGCGGSSYVCVCEDGHMKRVEMANRGTPPVALPARAGAFLCRDACQANEVPAP